MAFIEFIVSNHIKVHPLALLQPEIVDDPAARREIEELTAGYSDKPQFFVDTLTRGVGMIAATFYPRDVIVRLSDSRRTSIPIPWADGRSNRTKRFA